MAFSVVRCSVFLNWQLVLMFEMFECLHVSVENVRISSLALTLFNFSSVSDENGLISVRILPTLL